MSKKFKCVSGWARHSAGDIIPESEYNRLPYEIKQHGNFEEIPEVIEQAFSEGFQAIVVEPNYVTVDVSDPTFPKILVNEDRVAFTEIPPVSDVAITVDPFVDDEKPKVNKNKKY